MDLARHLAVVKIRPAVVRHLIAELRRSGHAGYEEQSAADVARRTRALYGDDSTPPFVPPRIKQAIEDAWEQARGARLKPRSLIQDKNATPSEPLDDVAKIELALRPLQIVAERSSSAASAVHESYASTFESYPLDVQTSSTMMDQFKA